MSNFRYSYWTVSYGLVTLMGELYDIGRIEVHDKDSQNPFHIHEGTYCIPHDSIEVFNHFIRSLKTNLPIQIELGSIDWCKSACANYLGLTEDELNNPEVIKEFYKTKYQNHEK